MKGFTLLLVTFFLSAYVFSQSSGKIKGIVQLTDGKAINSATVELLKVKDSSLVKATVTANDGRYEFENIKAGNYFIHVSHVGFKAYFSKEYSVSFDAPALNLDPVIISELSAGELKEVKVNSKKPFIEQKIDRTIINVEASISNAGSNALEVLEKSPGVSVDKDGNVSLKGRAGVLILMDGRPTYLSGDQLANYLRGLPASAIEQIELMPNPPAKYDAAGNAGVINIKTKKNRVKGFNGNLNLNYSQGTYARTSNSLNLNYRNNKWNISTNYNYWYWQGYNDLYVKRNFFKKGTKDIETIFEQNAFIRMAYPGHTGKIAIDYYLTKKTTIGVVFTGNYETGDEPGENISYIKDATEKVNSIVQANNNHNTVNKNFGVNLNLRHQFDSAGKEFSVDLDYLDYNLMTNQNFRNQFFTASWVKNRPDEILRGELPSLVKIYSGKADYSHPLKKDSKIEAGVKTSFVRTNNDARYFLQQNNLWIVDSGRSNHFIYEENINAAYLNYNKQFKKLAIQAGVRLENTNVKGHQFINDSSFNQHYTQFFPTLFLQYTPDEKQQIGLSLGRRIDRPAYQDLNPFRYFLDPYTYEQGNPFLRPQFTYNSQLSHTYKGFFTTTLSYSRTKDIFTEALDQIDQDTITFVHKENIARARNMGISVSANFNVTKWWTTNLYANMYNVHFNGLLNNKPIDVSGTTLQMNASNQFDLGKGWSAELSGWFQTRAIEGQIIINPLGQLNTAIQKKILKDKATIKISVRDIFLTQSFSGKFVLDNIDATVKITKQTRVLSIGFTYRFGKTNSQSQRNKTSGAEEEQNRVKKGGAGN